MIILRRVLKLPLIAAFVGIVAVGIMLTGYLFQFYSGPLGAKSWKSRYWAPAAPTARRPRPWSPRRSRRLQLDAKVIEVARHCRDHGLWRDEHAGHRDRRESGQRRQGAGQEPGHDDDSQRPGVEHESLHKEHSMSQQAAAVKPARQHHQAAVAARPLPDAVDLPGHGRGRGARLFPARRGRRHQLVSRSARPTSRSPSG